MIVKKILFAFSIVAIAGFAAFILYVFNEEKFYGEYWLQNQLNSIEIKKSVYVRNEPAEVIRYKFYHSPEIDVSIELDNEGFVIVSQNDWYAESKNLKSYQFQIDNKVFNSLKTKFTQNWKQNIITDVEYNLGAIYYQLELIDSLNSQNKITVGYYNTAPDKEFVKFKDELIKLAKVELEN